MRGVSSTIISTAVKTGGIITTVSTNPSPGSSSAGAARRPEAAERCEVLENRVVMDYREIEGMDECAAQFEESREEANAEIDSPCRRKR